MVTYTIIVVTAILIGFVCATIAKQKGKDPVKWFVIGVVLNVLALAIIHFYGRKKHATADRAISE